MTVFATLITIALLAYFIARTRFAKNSNLPKQYGYVAFLWVFLFAAITNFILSFTVLADYRLIFAIIVGITIALLLLKVMSGGFHPRKHIEKFLNKLFFICAFISVSLTILIVASVLVESIQFFDKVAFTDFLFGTEWSPQTAIREDQAGGSGSFGVVPILSGTLLITAIAMVVAVPLGLMSAIYLSEYASSRTRNIFKPILEVLAGVPTVVYGYFAAVTFAPFLVDAFGSVGVSISAESAIIAGSVMGIMIIPFVLSITDDVMNAVPNALRDASLGLGATNSETIRKVVIPAALPGVISGVLLAISRAIGETMIVVMAAGLAANLTLNPFESVTTITAQIVTILVGDQEFGSAKTLSAFALALTLFVITFILNIIALIIVKKYREKYD